MNLKEGIKEVLIKELEKLDINWINYYALENKSILNFLYREGIIVNDEIKSSLEKGVFRQARSDYKLMMKKHYLDKEKKIEYLIYADHVGRPECLAYALEKGIFSEKEILFDHGDNAEIFQKHYGEKIYFLN